MQNLTTARLFLRKPELTDAQTIFDSYATDPEVTKYMIWKPHQNVAETEHFLKTCLEKWRSGEEYSFVVEDRQTHELLGMASLRIKENQKAEVGYVLKHSAWGQGYTTELTKKLIEVAFQATPVTSILGSCDIDNKASARVLEKAGLHFKTIKKNALLHPNISDQKRDIFIYELAKDEYRKQT